MLINWNSNLKILLDKIIISCYTCKEFALYLWYSVLALRSSISTLGNPLINNSSSCSLNIEISRLGIIS